MSTGVSSIAKILSAAASPICRELVTEVSTLIGWTIKPR